MRDGGRPQMRFSDDLPERLGDWNGHIRRWQRGLHRDGSSDGEPPIWARKNLQGRSCDAVRENCQFCVNFSVASEVDPAGNFGEVNILWR